MKANPVTDSSKKKMESQSQEEGKEEELDIIKEEEVETLISFVKEKEGYKVVYKKGSTIVEQKKVKGLASVRLTCIIDGSNPKECFDMLDDQEFIYVYDHMCQKWTIVRQIDEHRDISWYMSKSPFPLVSARDFVTTRYKKIFDDETERHVLVNRNTVHKDAPVLKKVIRGYVYHTVFYFEKINENQTRLVYITKSDLKGWVPKWGMNWLTKTTAPKMLKTVVDSLPKYREFLKKKKNENK